MIERKINSDTGALFVLAIFIFQWKIFFIENFSRKYFSVSGCVLETNILIVALVVVVEAVVW